MKDKWKINKEDINNLLKSCSEENKRVVNLMLRVIKDLKVKNTELETMLFTDALTGAFNRHYYNEKVVPNSEKQGYYVIVADVNDLKKVNDTLGHKLGDKIILNTVSTLKQFGEVIRLGGDEFLVVCGKDAPQLKGCYQEFSYGVVKKEKGVNVTEAFNTADELLYYNKKVKNINKIKENEITK